MKQIITLLTCLTLPPALAQATVYFYDGFDYTAAQNVTGLSSWIQSATNTSQWTTVTGLSFNSLQTTGGAIQKVNGDQGLIYQDVTGLFTNIEETTFWASWLVRQEVATGNIHTHFAGNDNSENVNRGFGALLNGGKIDARINSGGASGDFSDDFALGNTYLIISKATDNPSGNDSNSAWIFPDTVNVSILTDEAALNSNALASATLADRIGNLGDRIMLNAVAGTSATIDEFRIGSTLASVTPVPEPRFYAAALGLAVLGFVAFRRRQS